MNETKLDFMTLMNLFLAINKLRVFNTIDQSIDILDVYFKTGDAGVLTTFDNIREYVVSSGIRETILPIYETYAHLANFLNEIAPMKKKEEPRLNLQISLFDTRDKQS